MDEQKQKSAKNLAETCKRSGYLPIFLGILVCFIGVMNAEFKDIIIGLFMFIVGYSFYKIGAKINSLM